MTDDNPGLLRPDMTVHEAVRAISAFLQKRAVDGPLLSAQLLVAFALDIPRDRLILRYNEALGSEAAARAASLAERRGGGEPAAYILGVREFWGLDFAVGPGVLVPRPETEHCVEAVLDNFGKGDPLRFADLGTGSGILPVTVAVVLPESQGVGVDISPTALDYACRNARSHSVMDRLQFIQADFAELPFSSGELDLVLSNPPYVSEEEYGGLSAEVKDHEPRGALVPSHSGVTGVEDYERIIPQAHRILRPGGLLVMEIGWKQGGSVLQLCAQSEGWRDAHVRKDLAGLDRTLVAFKS